LFLLLNLGSSGFTVKEYSPQRHSAAKPQPKVGKAGFTAEAQDVRKNPFSRKSAVASI
jgi:hypothetical protein